MRRNGHRWVWAERRWGGNGKQTREKGAGRAGVHARALAVYTTAWTLHADAFQRSRWAHQIRIRVFTLDLDVRACESRRCPETPDVPKPRSSAAESRNLVISGARFHLAICSLLMISPLVGLRFRGHMHTCIPPPLLSLSPSIFLAPKQLMRLCPPPLAHQPPTIPTLLHRQAEGLRPPSPQSKFTGKWNPLYAKQTMRRK